jgi:hypothetical protein
MIEHPTKSNSKNIGLDWIGLLDWIELKKSNPKIQLFWICDIERELKIQLFWIFGVGFGWMFNHSSNPNSRKKLTS